MGEVTTVSCNVQKTSVLIIKFGYSVLFLNRYHLSLATKIMKCDLAEWWNELWQKIKIQGVRELLLMIWKKHGSPIFWLKCVLKLEAESRIPLPRTKSIASYATRRSVEKRRKKSEPRGSSERGTKRGERKVAEKGKIGQVHDSKVRLTRRSRHGGAGKLGTSINATEWMKA